MRKTEPPPTRRVIAQTKVHRASSLNLLSLQPEEVSSDNMMTAGIVSFH